MRRDLEEFTGKVFDLVVIGGGIYGVCIARDAALRGLTVALVEKLDFGHATSFNSLKIIHGGFRYLQHLDIRRMRESINERMVLMRIAPHLVHPIPFVMPTYGPFFQGKAIMRVALMLNDLIGFDRNGIEDPRKWIPRGRIISKAECLQLIPGIPEQSLTGGAVWHDAQMRNSERLILAILKAAVEAGAAVGNYIEVVGFLMQGTRITGVKVQDNLSHQKTEIRGRYVVNASGPWVNQLLGLVNGQSISRRVVFSKAFNLAIQRHSPSSYAVGIPSQRTFKDVQAVVNKDHRIFFLVPWLKYTLIGTTHVPCEKMPDEFEVTEEEIQDFLDEINQSYESLCLKPEDICFVYGGLLPANPPRGAARDISLEKRHKIYDHGKQEGLEGLMSVVGVKWTESRMVAEKTVDLVCSKTGGHWPKSSTGTTPVDGGDIECFDSFLDDVLALKPNELDKDVLEHLVFNYGSGYRRVLEYIAEDPSLKNRVCDQSPVIKAEVIHAVRDEMALKLTDVVLRRTELGFHANSGGRWLATCAELLAKELGWDRVKVQRELEETMTVFRHSFKLNNKVVRGF
jgi:glycerol-3-phosphate dehydrogenase